MLSIGLFYQSVRKDIMEEHYIYLRIRVDVSKIVTEECTVDDIVSDCDYYVSFNDIELDTEIVDYE